MVHVACDEIYGVYGGDNSVTNILRMMQRDEKMIEIQHLDLCLFDVFFYDCVHLIIHSF